MRVVVANVSDEALTSGVEWSDRYVYANYFVPLLVTFDDEVTPILPFYVKQQLVELLRYYDMNEDRLHAILGSLDLPELWSTNDMDEAQERFIRSEDEQAVASSPPRTRSLAVTAGGAEFGDASELTPSSDESRERITLTIRAAEGLLAALAPELDVAGREVLSLASERLTESLHLLMPGDGSPRDTDVPVVDLVRPNVLTDQDLDLIAGLLETPVGFGFLDRTRISPIGFAIGEHVYALGLAPGEEVVLEQKTFTKRQATFEEQTDQERQFDIELSSTYSTELQEGLERQSSQSDTWGLNLSHTGAYSSGPTPWGQWDGNHTIAYTKNVTDANQYARKRSLKDGQQASGKVSARYRTQHKTLFRVTQEQGFEVASKRTIRNPNRVTPITLHYFKTLQRLRLRQERYGVRLCWAPSIRDPGRAFLDKIRVGRQRIFDEVMGNLPPEPHPPASSNISMGTTTRNQRRVWSPLIEADQDGALNAQNVNYTIDVAIEDGWSWDGDPTSVVADDSATERTAGTYNVRVFGTPVLVSNGVRVVVRVEAGERPSAPPIYFQVGVMVVQDVTISGSAGADVAYQAALEEWRSRAKDWADSRDAAIDRAVKAGDTFERDAFEGLSIVNEVISQIVDRFFHPSVRDDVWEIDFWQRLFEWERASFVTYPQWWSPGPVRDPLRDSSDFINASWAKLYLPVRVGMEKVALRWIFGKAGARLVHPAVEKRFDQIIEDLSAFRTEFFGAPEEVVEVDDECESVQELFKCLAEWTELLPTDGTHVEVVQGATSAADRVTAAEIEAAADLHAAMLENEQNNARLKEKALEQMTEPARIEVRIGADGGGEIVEV
jgi:hypothetical protein